MSGAKMMPPVPNTTPERTPFERMTDFTRRLLAVPKSDVVTPKKPRKQAKRKRH